MSYNDIFREFGACVQGIMDTYARKRSKIRWIDKTPNYYKLLPFIDDLFDHKVLFLFLIRHPLDNIISLGEQFTYISLGQIDKEIQDAIAHYGLGFQCWAKYWREVNETILSFASLHPERAHLFRYEDLVHKPDKTVEHALHFIDEEFYPDIVQNAFTMQHDRGYQDSKINSTQEIHGRSAGRWRQWNSAQIESIWPIVADLAQRLGYGIET